MTSSSVSTHAWPRASAQTSSSIKHLKNPPVSKVRLSRDMAATSASSEFPHFTDGDVCIVVSTSKIYQLHSHVLRRVSSWFRDFLQPAAAVRLTAAARREGCAAWRFHLFVNPHDLDEIGQFVPIVSIFPHFFLFLYANTTTGSHRKR